MRHRDLPNKFNRCVTIRSEDVNEKERTVAVSFSSQTDKVRYYGMPEILLHETGAADFSSLRDAGSVLFNHDPNVIIGRPIDVTLDEKDRKGRAVIKFDDDAESDKVFKKVMGGSARGTSVGFRVDEWRILDSKQSWTSPGGQTFRGPAYLGVKWRAVEFSITPIPADPSVGVGRNVGPEEATGVIMNLQELRAAIESRGLLTKDATDEEVLALAARHLAKPQKGPHDDDGAGDAKEPEKRKSQELPSPEVAALEAVRAERIRVREIEDVCSLFPETESLARGLVDSGATVEQARKECLEAYRKTRPSQGAPRGAQVEVGVEEQTKWRAAAEDRIALRTAWGREELRKDAKREAAASEVGIRTLMDFARESLRRARLLTPRMSDDDIIQRAISHTSSDFANVLMNVANKSLVKAYAEVPATWRPFATITSLQDFKTKYVTKFSQAGDLVETKDLEPMPETSFSDMSESYALKTYSRRIGLSRQAIINDDQGAFDRIPAEMGRAAARLPAKLFYDLLISSSGVGPTMAEDSKALFATDHTSGANYIAAAGAISITTLQAAKALMRLQKGMVAEHETAPTLNLTPSYLLVPAALEGVALQYTTQLIPNQSSNVVPLWQTALQVIVEPRLDGGTNGTVAWYLASSPSLISCCEVAFFNGNESPTMVRVEGTNILGVEWGIYHDVAVKFIDHRGWFRQRGA